MDYLLEMGDRAAFVEVISSDGLGLKGGRDIMNPILVLDSKFLIQITNIKRISSLDI